MDNQGKYGVFAVFHHSQLCLSTFILTFVHFSISYCFYHSKVVVTLMLNQTVEISLENSYELLLKSKLRTLFHMFKKRFNI